MLDLIGKSNKQAKRNKLNILDFSGFRMIYQILKKYITNIKTATATKHMNK